MLEGIGGAELRRLTAVVAVEDAKSKRPDEDENDGEPAIVIRRVAACNGKDVVALRLDDVLGDEHPSGKRKAKCNLDGQLFPSLGTTWG